jgi:hypothetical protein
MWKMYAQKHNDENWTIAFAPSKEEAAKAIDHYFRYGNPFPSSPTDPTTLEDLGMKSLSTVNDGVLSLHEYQQQHVPVPIYFGYYNPTDDQWVLPEPNEFEWAFGFKHPEMRYACDCCERELPWKNWIFEDGKRFCSEACREDVMEEREEIV